MALFLAQNRGDFPQIHSRVTMKRTIGILLLVLFATTLVFAQEPQVTDDHDDKAPIQSGYAVITPIAAGTGGTTTGLVVFETFGRRRDFDGTPQAGVLP